MLYDDMRKLRGLSMAEFGVIDATKQEGREPNDESDSPGSENGYKS